MKVSSVKVPRVRSGKAEEPAGIVAIARTDRRTKNLTRRLGPGEIAIIDHADLDRVSADELISCKVAAVVNVAQSMTGRYPNLGPQLLLDAGIPLVDDCGTDAITRVTEGSLVRLDGPTIYLDDQIVAKGTVQTQDTVDASMATAREGVATQIDSFAANTLEFLRRERDLLTNGVPVPGLRTNMRDRHVLVVVRGYRYKEDLRTLRPYIREFHPVMIAVDAGADALLDAGYRPDLIIGDMDSISDEALCAGAELVVHAYPDGRAPGMTRVAELGLTAHTCAIAGTSEDVALLLADAGGASLIPVVGTHWTLEEFLDKGRPGMASTFLTHLRVGGKVVNARGVHQLYHSRISGWVLLALPIAAAITIVVGVFTSPTGSIWTTYFTDTWHTFSYWFTGLF
jgi:uncharacterized membrane-anchored protein